MRAWWSSRSSKPLPRHFVPGGRFDSYPLRHCFGRGPSLRSGFRLRAPAPLPPAKRLKFDSYPLRQLLKLYGSSPNFAKGGDRACHASKFES